jgi:hypothetical protein
MKLIYLSLLSSIFFMGCRPIFSSLTLPITLVVDGNSLTQSRNGVESMPSMVNRQLPGMITLDEQSESGIGMVEMLQSAHLARVYNAFRRGAILLVWEINHDISTGGFTADQAVDRLWYYCDLMRSHGYKIITLTTLPARGGVFAYPDFENKRLAVNVRMRAEWSSHVDTLIDIASTAMGSATAPLEGVYYSPIDTVHLSTAGAELVSSLVAPAVEAIINSYDIP